MERIKLKNANDISKGIIKPQLKKENFPGAIPAQQLTKTKHHISIKSPLKLEQTSEFKAPTVYSQEALRAVGLGFSPNVAGSTAVDESEPQTIIPFENQSHHSPAKPMTNMSYPAYQLEINVIRAWELSDCLGGTNSYVLTKLSSSTESLISSTILNSTSPYYGSKFLLKLPLNNSSIADENPEEMLGTFLYENSVRFVVLNKNMSLSDEMIGTAEVNVFSLLQQQKEQQSVSMQLLDQQGYPSGFLEIQAKLNGS